MKVFLTGGTGFIGKPLTRSLLARGWKVAALVNTIDGELELMHKRKKRTLTSLLNPIKLEG